MKRIVCLFSLLLTWFTCGGAYAAVVQIDYTGSVTSLTTKGTLGSTLLTGNVAIGDAVSGRLRYSSNPSSSGTQWFYSLALESFELTVGAYNATATGGGIAVYNDDPSFKDSAIFNASVGVTGDSIGGVAPVKLQFSLLSSDPTALASTALPTVTDIGALWGSNIANGNINFLVWGEEGHTARYEIKSVTARAVPVSEPGAFALVVLALAAVAVARNRRVVA